MSGSLILKQGSNVFKATRNNLRCPTPTETFKYRFKDFKGLPHEVGDVVESPILQCHGYCWRIYLFPGGEKEEREDNGDVQVSAYIGLVDLTAENIQDPLLQVEFLICLDNGIYRDKYDVGKQRLSKNALVGCECDRRSIVLQRNLAGGDLTVSVEICIWSESRKPPWFPKINPQDDDLLKLLESAANSDVRFKVQDEHEFPAHRCILGVKAPALLNELAENVEPNGTIVVKNISSLVFRALLRFIYGRELPDEDFVESNGRDLLEAADRFGCKQLKLAAESQISYSFLTNENAADWLLFADSHSCALLKETAMELFARSPTTVMESDGWAKLTESNERLLELMNMLVGSTGNKRKVCASAWAKDYEHMKVATLREKLQDQGQDDDALDGTREMLVKRLKHAE